METWKGIFSLKECLQKTDYVFHCAGLTIAKTRQEFFRVNATACKSLYEQCVQYGKQLKRIVHISSLASVGPAQPDQPVDENTPTRPLTYYGKIQVGGRGDCLAIFILPASGHTSPACRVWAKRVQTFLLS